MIKSLMCKGKIMHLHFHDVRTKNYLTARIYFFTFQKSNLFTSININIFEKKDDFFGCNYFRECYS